MDTQTPISSSYKGKNEFRYWFLVKDKSVTNTSEIQADLKEFVKYAQLRGNPVKSNFFFL